MLHRVATARTLCIFFLQVLRSNFFAAIVGEFSQLCTLVGSEFSQFCREFSFVLGTVFSHGPLLHLLLAFLGELGKGWVSIQVFGTNVAQSLCDFLMSRIYSGQGSLDGTPPC